MTVPLVSRTAWGAKPWRPQRDMYRKTPRDQIAVFAHYHGGPPRNDHGTAMAREIESIHLANGWAGTGYTAMIGQDGIAFEGRGWDLVTAACPGWNRNAWHFYVAVGADQNPTPAALHTFAALYAEACLRAHRTALLKTWHGAHYPTECPGRPLRTWARAGMQDPLRAHPIKEPSISGGDMPTAREIADEMLNTPVPTGEKGTDGTPLTFRWLFVRDYLADGKIAAQVADLQAQVADLQAQVALLVERSGGRP